MAKKKTVKKSMVKNDGYTITIGKQVIKLTDIQAKKLFNDLDNVLYPI